MTNEEYKKIVEKNKPVSKKWINALMAFITGGLIGLLSEIISYVLVNNYNIEKVISYQIVCIVLILLASLFTCLGFFDNLVSKAGCGLIIPTTGFASSVSSSALEYKKDGMITGLGSNFFKLAGSVIVFGIISAFVFCVIKVML